MLPITFTQEILNLCFKLISLGQMSFKIQMFPSASTWDRSSVVVRLIQTFCVMVMFTQRMYQGFVYKIENVSTTQVTQSKGDGGESRVRPQTFRSRWTTLFWWRKATPSRICLMSLFTSSSRKASSSWSDTHWLKISPPAALQQKTHDVGQISCKSVDWPSVMCQCQSILHHSGLQTLKHFNV